MDMEKSQTQDNQSVIDMIYEELASSELKVHEYFLQDATRGAVREVSGFVHTKTCGAGLLFSECLNIFKIPMMICVSESLETGDWIDATVAEQSDGTVTVSEIKIAATPIRFRGAEIKMGGKKFLMGRSKLETGKRAAVKTKKEFDRLEDILVRAAEDTGEIQFHKIVLSLDEDFALSKHLEENGIDEAFVVPIDLSKQKQVAVCVYALFRAQYMAAKGNNVMFFVDNLSKLLRLYNHCAVSDADYVATHLNFGAIQDVKQFFITARNLKNGGSLTPVMYINDATCCDSDKRVYEEFSDLVQILMD